MLETMNLTSSPNALFLGMDYQKAGVDIRAMDRVKKRIGKAARSTFTEHVATDFGHFGGAFRLRGFRKPVLVASTDSVGTKVKIAQMAKIYNTVGEDIVNHSVNDLLCTGAKPLFFLDYLAFAELESIRIAVLIEGIARACRKESIALIGGETAQLPGLYKPGDFDLVGTIVGAIEEGMLIDGSKLKAGDIAIGLRSTGLHTNGYSLARKALLEGRKSLSLKTVVSGTKKTLSEVLLAVHRSYQMEIEAARPLLKGIAHITGGGLHDNVSRLLPEKIDCIFKRKRWKVPAIFRLIQERGAVSEEEMYRVFNMGIGMVLFADKKNSEEVRKATHGIIIGCLENGKGVVHLI